MKGVEIDFVVKDSLKALELYEQIFDLEVVEKTSFPVGSNEVIFNLYGTRFHILDENLEFGLKAPGEEGIQSVWFNVLVEDIEKTWERAMELGCVEIMSLNHMEEMGATNAIFGDGLGYSWMLHEIHRIVSFEEREEFFKKEMEEK